MLLKSILWATRMPPQPVKRSATFRPCNSERRTHMKDAHSDTTRRWALGGLIGGLGISLVAMSVCASLPWATDVLKISSLLADPTGYNMKLVRVEGVVLDHQMQHFIGNFTKLEKCIQRFMVKDDTASIQAVY